MKNFNFYAVEDEKGLVSIKNEKYETLKGIFREKKDAEKVITNNPSKNLKIIEVNIVSKIKKINKSPLRRAILLSLR